jgi:hypothetical protein
MTSSNLRDDLVSIPGVADAEVTLTDSAAPVARIWLDGSRDHDEVREKVEALLGGTIPAVGTQVTTAPRRTGLGKGLDTLIPNGEADRVPSQLKPQVESRAASVARVAVVESADAVTVEIEDGAGHVFTAAVGPSGSIDRAVMQAMAAMVAASADVAFHIGETSVDGVRVIVVTARHEGRTSAGAAAVDFGRPYAVARATRQALDGM